MTLEDFFRAHDRAAVAFSGGADSAFLLWAAKGCGCRVTAYFVDTAFQPSFALPMAKALAKRIGVPLKVLTVDVLSMESVCSNPENRCYFCKKAMFSLLRQTVSGDGYPVLLDGSNASDDAGDRPGMRALDELSVLSPLRLCGLTKKEIRRRSKAAGLPTWDLPAYACLATRIPTGTPITGTDLIRIDKAETLLRQAGFSDFRLRLRPWGALLQLTEGQMPRWEAQKKTLSAALRPFFPLVRLDETPRIGEEMP